MWLVKKSNASSNEYPIAIEPSKWARFPTYFLKTPIYLLRGYNHLHVTRPKISYSSTRWMMRWFIKCQKEGGNHALSKLNVSAMNPCNYGNSFGPTTLDVNFWKTVDKCIMPAHIVRWSNPPTATGSTTCNIIWWSSFFNVGHFPPSTCFLKAYVKPIGTFISPMTFLNILFSSCSNVYGARGCFQTTLPRCNVCTIHKSFLTPIFYISCWAFGLSFSPIMVLNILSNIFFSYASCPMYAVLNVSDTPTSKL